MPLFTIDVAGLPVMVFPAADAEDARRTADGDGLAEDLATFEHAGRPLWDGSAPLMVREAVPAECDAWDAGFAIARADGEVDEEDREDWSVFLVDVTEGGDPA